MYKICKKKVVTKATSTNAQETSKTAVDSSSKQYVQRLETSSSADVSTALSSLMVQEKELLLHRESRRDYWPNDGKAVQFHCQGLKKSDIEVLAQALTTRYGWDVRVKFDYKNEKDIEFDLIQVEAKSFEAFVETVKPNILPNFQKRLSKPRVNRY